MDGYGTAIFCLKPLLFLIPEIFILSLMYLGIFATETRLMLLQTKHVILEMTREAINPECLLKLVLIYS